MSDEDSTDLLDAGALSAMYLETLRLRMEPEKFGVLADALSSRRRRRPARRHGNEELFTDEVRREVATVLTMAATGRTDDRGVQAVERYAGMGWVVVTAEVADDPVKLAELRAQLLRMVEEGELSE